MNSPKVLRSLIVVFTLVTALVHLWLVYNGMTRARNPSISYPFLINGVGYLALLGAFFLTRTSREQWHRLVQYLLMAFAAGSIVAWIIINHGRFFLALSIFDKAIEVLLIVVVWRYLRLTQQRRSSEGVPVSGHA